ncbi:hypothetical protein AB0L64_10085 [Kribbella sp. NPDC051936]|uniref:hypothetical protein n=1 Tax=Kribbella sp. NPDC051936 TaxID=3154946 RepID=UPI00344A8622
MRHAAVVGDLRAGAQDLTVPGDGQVRVQAGILVRSRRLRGRGDGHEQEDREDEQKEPVPHGCLRSVVVL